jgi:hypothetical protein
MGNQNLMQLTQNKRLDAFLIEFFDRFFCLCVHFRTSAFSAQSSYSNTVARWVVALVPPDTVIS